MARTGSGQSDTLTRNLGCYPRAAMGPTSTPSSARRPATAPLHAWHLFLLFSCKDNSLRKTVDAASSLQALYSTKHEREKEKGRWKMNFFMGLVSSILYVTTNSKKALQTSGFIKQPFPKVLCGGWGRGWPHRSTLSLPWSESRAALVTSQWPSQ